MEAIRFVVTLLGAVVLVMKLVDAKSIAARRMVAPVSLDKEGSFLIIDIVFVAVGLSVPGAWPIALGCGFLALGSTAIIGATIWRRHHTDAT